MIKITGLDGLMKTMDNLQKALSAIEGDIGVLSFNPTNPASIEQAIQQMEELIDTRVAPWSNEPAVAQIAQAMKDRYRTAILDKAADARLRDGAESDE